MKILIAGYYGFGNLGDELILSSVISQLKSRYQNPELTVLSANPSETTEYHRVNAIPRWNPMVVARHLWRNDFLIVGGGGLIQNKTSRRSLFYYLGLIALARFVHCPVILFAMGVESLEGKFARWFTRKILTSPEVKITVRDEASKRVLCDIGLPSPLVHITADPVFARGVTRVTRERYALPSNSVLLVPRFPCPPSGRRIFAILGRILREEKKMKVRGLLFQPQTEREYLNSFNGESILSAPDFLTGLSIEEMALEIQHYDWVISARFHGLVLAALAGRPFIGVGDPHKVGRLCALLKMPHLSWEASEEEIGAAIEKISLKNTDTHADVVDQLSKAALQTTNHVG